VGVRVGVRGRRATLMAERAEVYKVEVRLS